MADQNRATLIVDGFAGAGNVLQGATFSDIASFCVNVRTGILRMVDADGKNIDVAISTAATMVVAIANGNYTVTIAD